jgi:hypothetical protein
MELVLTNYRLVNLLNLKRNIVLIPTLLSHTMKEEMMIMIKLITGRFKLKNQNKANQNKIKQRLKKPIKENRAK